MLTVSQIDDIAIWLEGIEDFDPLAESALINAAGHVIELVMSGEKPTESSTFQVLMIGAILVQAGFESDARALAADEAERLERQLLDELVNALLGSV